MARETRRRGAEETSAAQVESDPANENGVNRTTEEVRRAEEARVAEEARLEEEARATVQAARELEAAHLAEVARVAEAALRAEEARTAENARLAEEARNAEIARKAREDVAPGGMDALMGMLAQVLARVPPVGVPVRDPILDVVDGEANQLPSYIKMLELIRKMGTKYFKGGSDLMAAEEWRSRLERNFASIRCPDQYKKDIAVHHLEGDAHLWWRGVTAQMGDQECTFEMFREKFQAKYFPEEAFDRLNAEFLELRQGTKTVREFEARFNTLKVFAGRDYEGEKAQVRRFLKGLRTELRNNLLVRNYDTLTELVEKAALLEDSLKEDTDSNGEKPGVPMPNRKTGPKKEWPKGGDKSVTKRKTCPECGKMHSGACRTASGACHRCGSMGHQVRDCPEEDKRQRVPSKAEPAKTCYHCGEVGHIRPNCPKMGSQSTGKRASEGTGPAAKRPNVTPRVYSATTDGAVEASTSRPITGQCKKDLSEILYLKQE